MALVAVLVSPVLGCSGGSSDADVADALDIELDAFYGHLAEIDSSLDVCDEGGDEQQCHAASATYIEILIDHRQRVTAVNTDRASRETFLDGLEVLIAGFEQRNRGLETQSDADVEGGNEAIAAGTEALERARQEWESENG